jgi:hypothetical protein
LERVLNRLIYTLMLSLLVMIILVCNFLSYRFEDIQYFLTIILFNILFITLFFQLYCKLIQRIITLTCGNVICLLWSIFFQNISNTGYHFFGNSFSVFYNIIYPILTMIWVVPFWSLSLSFLPKPLNQKEMSQ